jgi:hypothetical protein
MQVLTKAQLREMEINMRESGVVANKRCTIMDRTTFLDEGIRIRDLEQFMWI